MADTRIHKSWLEDETGMPEYLNGVPCHCGTLYRALTDQGLLCMECGEIMTGQDLIHFIESHDETRH